MWASLPDARRLADAVDADDQYDGEFIFLHIHRLRQVVVALIDFDHFFDDRLPEVGRFRNVLDTGLMTKLVGELHDRVEADVRRNQHFLQSFEEVFIDCTVARHQFIDFVLELLPALFETGP